jgi:hypothetical protein
MFKFTSPQAATNKDDPHAIRAMVDLSLLAMGLQFGTTFAKPDAPRSHKHRRGFQKMATFEESKPLMAPLVMT